jgi:hypothetical protein
MSTLNTLSYRVSNITATKASSSNAQATSALFELNVTQVDGKEKVCRFECGPDEMAGLVGQMEEIEKLIKKSSGTAAQGGA